MVTVGLAAIFAGVFFQVGAHRLERQRDYVSILFFFVAHWSWYPLFKTMGAYPTQRDVLTRERASDSYAIAAWSMAHVLGEWSTAWMHPLLFYIVAYPLAALPVRAFPSLFVINMINLEVSSALGAFIAAAAFDQKGAFSLAIVTMAFCMLAGGFFVDLSTQWQPAWLSSLSYFSYWTYSFGLVMHAALPEPGELAAFNQTLASYSFADELPAALNVGVLLAWALALRLGAYLLVLHSKKLRFS